MQYHVGTKLQVKPMTAHIGAEISGVDLSKPLDDTTFQAIYQAYLRWKVVFFRDQDIGDVEHTAFARRFGSSLHVHPIGPGTNSPELIELRRGANQRSGDNEFHADATFEEKPPKCSVLRCIQVPEYGGDTVWVDMARALQSLPSSTREFIRDLHAVHDFDPVFGHWIDAEQFASKRAELPLMKHPIIIRHPETGEDILFVNPNFTTHIADYLPKKHMSAIDALDLLRELFGTLRLPEHQVRFRWAPGSIAVWDNWATQHYAVYDYGDPAGGTVKRVMRRVTVNAVVRPSAGVIPANHEPQSSRVN